MEAAHARGEKVCPDTAAERALLGIRHRLCAAGYQVLRHIECDYCDGVVVLRGRVTTYYFKQLAQAALLTDPAVERIVNLIEVSDDNHRASVPE